MIRPWIVFLSAIVFFSSCVPNRKLVYLQQDDIKNRKEIPKDSVLRKHPMAVQEVRIQPLDILSITFESLTTSEFDFFSQSSPNINPGGGNMANLALGGILVDGNGEIEYPVVGKIKVSGLTVFEVERNLKAIAMKYLRDVVVRVRLINFRYTLLGEVNSEKTVTSNTTRLTMMEAIAQGGGLSELADRSHVKVIRQVGNESQIHYIDLLKEDFIESPFYFVQQNDVIIVPPLRQRPFKRYFTSNVAIITTAISTVFFFVSISDRL